MCLLTIAGFGSRYHDFLPNTESKVDQLVIFIALLSCYKSGHVSPIGCLKITTFCYFPGKHIFQAEFVSKMAGAIAPDFRKNEISGKDTKWSSWKAASQTISYFVHTQCDVRYCIMISSQWKWIITGVCVYIGSGRQKHGRLKKYELKSSAFSAGVLAVKPL